MTSLKPVEFQGLRTLALGLTEVATVNGEQFQPLLNVTDEVNQVTELFPGSKKLLNEQFTRNALEQELKQADYPIIHIATHGQSVYPCEPVSKSCEQSSFSSHACRAYRDVF